MNSLIFNSIAALLIPFIILWFWVIKNKASKVQKNEITILVEEGAYSPNRIETSNTEITLNFIRKDKNPCAEYVLFETLDIHEPLPFNQTHKIVLEHLKPGQYRFNCQMGMYQGELIVHSS